MRIWPVRGTARCWRVEHVRAGFDRIWPARRLGGNPLWTNAQATVGCKTHRPARPGVDAFTVKLLSVVACCRQEQ